MVEINYPVRLGDLTPDLYEEAVDEMLSQSDTWYPWNQIKDIACDRVPLTQAFDWIKSARGVEFWARVERGENPEYLKDSLQGKKEVYEVW